MHVDGFPHLAGHDQPVDARAFEAADDSAEPEQADPMETLNQLGQLGICLVPQADTNYRNPQASCLFGEDNRETTAAGQKSDGSGGRMEDRG